MIKRLLLIAVALLPAGVALAQEGGEIALLHAGTDITDIPSLQRGARNFMNYCSGCHSLTYLRYNRMAEDLKIPEADLKANLMFTSNNGFDGINSAMPARCGRLVRQAAAGPLADRPRARRRLPVFVSEGVLRRSLPALGRE